MMRRGLDGALLLDKPAGVGSNALLQAVKRLYGAAKAGHAGTLDPLASGLLVVLFGEATKFARLALDADKEYVARACHGVTTD
ncbi:MAG: tRNA pseudouridine(55) synthase TruB, partial [Burkholderiales bacterium]